MAQINPEAVGLSCDPSNDDIESRLENLSTEAKAVSRRQAGLTNWIRRVYVNAAAGTLKVLTPWNILTSATAFLSFISEYSIWLSSIAVSFSPTTGLSTD
ncbi:hypothetical protein V1515DRAFT_620266 [Lipomyces mesembrius]